MNDRTTPRINKIPFIIADLILLAAAVWIAQHSPAPLTLKSALLCSGLVIVAALFSIIPFLTEFKAARKAAESNNLADAVAQIKNLESVAKQIATATAQWQDIQNSAGKTNTAAKEIAARMEEEVKGFTEFMQKSNDSEKAALRLEVDKLRRAEGDFLQIVVRILDHIYALHQAGERSGNPELAAQLGHFQHACRDVARRIGLVLFIAEPNEGYDGQRHKLLDNAQPAAGAIIAETLAPGFTFQGQLLRPALVKLQAAEPAPVAPPEPQPAQQAPPEDLTEPTLL